MKILSQPHRKMEKTGRGKGRKVTIIGVSIFHFLSHMKKLYEILDREGKEEGERREE